MIEYNADPTLKDAITEMEGQVEYHARTCPNETDPTMCNLRRAWDRLEASGLIRDNRPTERQASS